MSDPIVGIDLGTSNSAVAFAEEAGAVKVLSDESGYKIHPSVVSFHPNGGVVVGAPAKQRKVIDPQNTIYSVKRLIGRAFSSPEVKTAKKRMPYQIKEGANELPLISTRAGEFAVPEISAIVLDHVRNVASAQLGTQVSRAVVTVPASFNDAQRSATATAGAIAGLTVVRVLNEPTAAALAYGHARNLRQTIAVFDFGGGTFDITILRLHDQVFEVLGTAGDTFLGGDDLDERLVDRMVAKFLAENRIDLRTNEVSMMRLRAVAEQTKIELSRRSRAVVRVDEIAYGPNGKPLNLHIEITRDEFVSQVADIIDKTFPVCREALAYASLGVEGVDDVLLVGGTTKIPYVRDQVSKFFGKAPRTDISPEDAVAMGAALQGASLEQLLTRSVSQRMVAPVIPTPTPTPERIEATIDDLLEAPTASNTLEELTEAPTASTVFSEIDPDEPSGAVMQTFGDLATPPVLPPRPEPAFHGRAPNKQPISNPDVRADTEYSIARTGTRDVFQTTTPPPAAPPAPPTGAIGRLRSTAKGPALDAKGDPKKTAFGVPPAPLPSPVPSPLPSPAPVAPAPPPLAPAPFHHDEPRILKHLQMLHDCAAIQFRHQAAEHAGRAGAWLQGIEDPPPGAVAQGLEQGVVLVIR